MKEPRTLGSTHQDLSLFTLGGTRNAGSLPVQVRLGKPRLGVIHRPYTFNKILHKADHTPNCKIQKCKTSRTDIEENLDDSGFDSGFLDTTPKA